MPFREKIWMRALQRAMAGKNPPKMILVGEHHVPKIVRRINEAGYQATYEWLPRIEPGVREAYRLDAERRRTKVLRKAQRGREKIAMPRHRSGPR